MRLALVTALLLSLGTQRSALAQAPTSPDVSRLVAGLEGDTPMLRDLEQLTDVIGGRATGSPANLRAVEWAMARFQEAGVSAKREPFRMPTRWLERAASATVQGGSGAGAVRFTPRVAAMPFSKGTSAAGVSAPLVDAGIGDSAAFARLGAAARDAFVLVEQGELKDVDGLFKEYADAAAIEQRAYAAGVKGVVYMGSRPNDLLYRHNVAIGDKNTRPMLVMERDGAARALRLIRAGTPLTLTAVLDLDDGGAYDSYNVIGEIRGSTKPDEIVLLGAHLDSWDLGGGALDNGANVAMLIDVARQMTRLGIHPQRTIRFALWNGEEQGMVGSMGYAASHAAELDRHAMAAAFDIGCGKINGFFTGGRPELAARMPAVLSPVAGLGPFTQIDAPIVGTDNFDFMLHGVANLVANQEPASYGPNYHARSDEYDRCDPQQLRLNAAVSAAVALGFANAPDRLPRQTRADVEALMARTDLAEQMKTFDVWDGWAAGTRGRRQ